MPCLQRLSIGSSTCSSHDWFGNYGYNATWQLLGKAERHVFEENVNETLKSPFETSWISGFANNCQFVLPLTEIANNGKSGAVKVMKVKVEVDRKKQIEKISILKRKRENSLCRFFVTPDSINFFTFQVSKLLSLLFAAFLTAAYIFQLLA